MVNDVCGRIEDEWMEDGNAIGMRW